MDWANELKDLETEVRKLPTATLSVEKNHDIYLRLQAEQAQAPKQHRRRRLLKMSLSTAGAAAAAVLAVGLYANAQSGGTAASVVQGAGIAQTAPKAAIYTVPAVGSSAHWDVELKASTSSLPKSEPNRPRYDVYLVYKGQGSSAHNVTVDEQGVGMWKPDGTVISRETMKVGELKSDRYPIYQNFMMLDEVPNLTFIISWLADGEQTQTEKIIIPRR